MILEMNGVKLTARILTPDSGRTVNILQTALIRQLGSAFLGCQETILKILLRQLDLSQLYF